MSSIFPDYAGDLMRTIQFAQQHQQAQRQRKENELEERTRLLLGQALGGNDFALQRLGQVNPNVALDTRHKLATIQKTEHDAQKEAAAKAPRLEDVERLGQMAGVVQQNPAAYPTFKRMAELSGIASPGQLPEQYDPQQFGQLLGYFQQFGNAAAAPLKWDDEIVALAIPLGLTPGDPNALKDPRLMAAVEEWNKAKLEGRRKGNSINVYNSMQEPTAATKNDLQKDIVTGIVQLGELENVLKNPHFDDVFTYTGKGRTKFLQELSRVKPDAIAPNDQKYLQDVNDVISPITVNYSRIKNELFGANQTALELGNFANAYTNESQDPITARHNLNRYITASKRALRLKAKVLRSGVPVTPETIGAEIDKLHALNDDGRSDADIDARGDELKRSGASDAEVIKTLIDEGYIDPAELRK